MEIPGSAGQLLIALLFIVPGSVYQAVRQRLRGPAPDDLNFSTKLFRAIGVSTALIALYLAVAGNRLLGLVVTRRGDAPSWDGVERHARPIGWLVLLLLLVIPALLGVLDYLRAARSLSLRRLGADPVPRAWDFAFKDLKPCFVRVLTTDGLWLGGWFGEASYVSSFPEPREIFIEVGHEIDSEGRIGRAHERSRGMYLRCDDIRAVHLVRRPLPSHVGDEGDFDGSGQAEEWMGEAGVGRIFSHPGEARGGGRVAGRGGSDRPEECRADTAARTRRSDQGMVGHERRQAGRSSGRPDAREESVGIS